MTNSKQFDSPAFTALALLLAVAAVGCGTEDGIGSPGADPEGIETAEEPIYKGTAVSTPGRHVRVESPSGWCTGTLMANNWVVTARHCGLVVNSTIVRQGSQSSSPTATVSVVLEHPIYDLALAHLSTSLRMNGSKAAGASTAR